MRRRRRASDRVHCKLRRPPGSRVNPSTLGFGKYPSRDAPGLNAVPRLPSRDRSSQRPANRFVTTRTSTSRPQAELFARRPTQQPQPGRRPSPGGPSATPTRAWCATGRGQTQPQGRPACRGSSHGEAQAGACAVEVPDRRRRDRQVWRPPDDESSRQRRRHGVRDYAIAGNPATWPLSRDSKRAELPCPAAGG